MTSTNQYVGRFPHKFPAKKSSGSRPRNPERPAERPSSARRRDRPSYEQSIPHTGLPQMGFLPVFWVGCPQRLSIGDSDLRHETRPLAGGQKHTLAVVVTAEKPDDVLFLIRFARSIQDSFPNHGEVLRSFPSHTHRLRRENGAEDPEKNAPMIF